ncbi:Guanine nucleotide exchange factor synembryn [Pelomyxa schiedti]|nr:Guanine nucleotide exchange factor synembryn [Pelomyxa schiedti]
MKEAFLAKVMLLIEEHKADSDVTYLTRLLGTLRLCCRDPSGLSVVLTGSAFSSILHFAELIDDTPRSPLLAEESTKVLLNFVMKHTPFRASFIEHNAHMQAIEKLKKYNSLSEEHLYMLLRVIGQVCLNFDSACSMNKNGVLLATFVILQQYQTSERFGLDVPPRTVVQAIRVVFIVTMIFSLLNSSGTTVDPTPQDLQTFGLLSAFWNQILICESPCMEEVKEIVVSCLVNSPRGWHTIVSSEILHGVLRSLLNLLNRHLTTDQKPEIIVPLCLVLAGLATTQEELRRCIKDSIFTAEIMAQSELANGGRTFPTGTAAFHLVKLMTTMNIGVKHAAEELIYGICNMNVNAVLDLVGFGNAAGLLHSKNLLFFGS